MKRHEREAIVDRIEREGATVGASIPERLDVNGETIALRERVLGFQRQVELGEDETNRLHELTVALRRERRARIERIENDPDLDRARAEELAESVVGIDRALAGLAGIGKAEDIEAEMQRQVSADAERWSRFLEKARGDDPDRGLSR